MPFYRCQMTRENANTNPSDVVSNTFYLNKTTIPGQGGADELALATDAVNAWIARTTPISDYPTYRCKIYDMADLKPRPVVAEYSASTVGGSASGPQEVALCLSFYAGRNLPRRRGRLYLGPFFAGEMAGRPSLTQQNRLLDLASDLANLGGADVSWRVYSPTDGGNYPVSNAWVDNAWDTQRSRGLAPTGRVLRATGS
jgi:hypothetical protein